MHLCRLIRFVWLLLLPPSSKTFSRRSLSPFSLSPLCLPRSLAHSPQLGAHLSGPADHRLMYCQAKMAARPYQTVKQQWFRSLQETGLGIWVKKPPEQEQFLLSV